MDADDADPEPWTTSEFEALYSIYRTSVASRSEPDLMSKGG